MRVEKTFMDDAGEIVSAEKATTVVFRQYDMDNKMIGEQFYNIVGESDAI